MEQLMYEIILSVCLAAEPQRCKEEHLTLLEEAAQPYQCMLQGQIEIVRWSETHPKWNVRRWTCAPAGRFATL
jgi:hypothetical protein